MNRYLSRAKPSLGLLCAGLLCVSAAPTSLLADARDEQIGELLRRIEALEKTVRSQSEQLGDKVAVLEKKQAMADADAVQSARSTPKIAAGPGGFTITSPDKAFNLKFGALVQLDGRYFLDDDGVANRDSFFLRRIRTPLSGTIAGIYDFNLTPELGANALSSTTSTVGLIDAWFSAKIAPEFSLKVGRFISPVALEPGANRHFMESPFVNTLLPNRDIGVEASGSFASDIRKQNHRT